MSDAKGMTAAVVTVSDSCSRGEKVDLSGPAVVEALERRGFRVAERALVADERGIIQEKLIVVFFCREARAI